MVVEVVVCPEEDNGPCGVPVIFPSLNSCVCVVKTFLLAESPAVPTRATISPCPAYERGGGSKLVLPRRLQRGLRLAERVPVGRAVQEQRLGLLQGAARRGALSGKAHACRGPVRALGLHFPRLGRRVQSATLTATDVFTTVYNVNTVLVLLFFPQVRLHLLFHRHRTKGAAMR